MQNFAISFVEAPETSLDRVIRDMDAVTAVVLTQMPIVGLEDLALDAMAATWNIAYAAPRYQAALVALNARIGFELRRRV